MGLSALRKWHAAVAVVAAACAISACEALGAAEGAVSWKLKYTEDFKGDALNKELWTRIESGTSDWNKNMSGRADLVSVKGGILTVYGVKNNDLGEDPRRVLTGGVMTKGLFAMKYGKVEVRCKLKAQKGAWPAIWLMPERPSAGWPQCGEIDIIERLNFDDFVYHTVHSGWTQGHPDDPPKSGKGAIRPDGWNVFGLEWTPEEIVWRVNGKRTHSYARKGDDPARYPWTEPFYLMIDMQLGGSWVGPVDESTLPVAMQVDWVKFYSGSRNGKQFSEFVRPSRL